MQVLASPGDWADNGRGSPAEFEQSRMASRWSAFRSSGAAGRRWLARPARKSATEPVQCGALLCSNRPGCFQIFLVHSYLKRLHTTTIATAMAPCKATFGAQLLRRRSPASNACPPGAYSREGRFEAGFLVSPGALAPSLLRSSRSGGRIWLWASFILNVLSPTPPAATAP